MLVAGNLHALSVHCLVYEFLVILAPSLEYFLQDMIAIDVVAHIDEARLEVLAHQLELDRSIYGFDELLN